MDQIITLWSPVVIARLKAPHQVRQEKTYSVEKVYKTIEDLKIKVTATQARVQGQAIEALIKLDILCLFEDLTGGMYLFSGQETVKEQVPLTAFDQLIDRERRVNYLLDIISLSWQGELNGTELQVVYFLDYMLMATREQAVTLSGEEQGQFNRESLDLVLRKLQEEVARVEEEKQELSRKIFFYEKDITSLKKGIRKAERRSAGLNKEVNQYQQLVEQLRQVVREKELRLSRYENEWYDYPSKGAGRNNISLEDSGVTLGSRIKRLFLNSL